MVWISENAVTYALLNFALETVIFLCSEFYLAIFLSTHNVEFKTLFTKLNLVTNQKLQCHIKYYHL
jgi:hypothetical protein